MQELSENEITEPGLLFMAEKGRNYTLRQKALSSSYSLMRTLPSPRTRHIRA